MELIPGHRYAYHPRETRYGDCAVYLGPLDSRSALLMFQGTATEGGRKRPVALAYYQNEVDFDFASDLGPADKCQMDIAWDQMPRQMRGAR
jgi:hypothetical protein